MSSLASTLTLSLTARMNVKAYHQAKVQTLKGNKNDVAVVFGDLVAK